jgi:type I restriction enzyme, S subunit
MIDGLKPYPEYKKSGLLWLSKIPAHWQVVRNGSLFTQRNQTGFAHLPILEVSLKTGIRVRDFENSLRKQVMSDFGKYKRAAKGDLAYNMMRMWQGAVGVAPVDGLVSPAYVVARPFTEVVARYYTYLFRTDVYMFEVDAYSRGIVKDRNRLYWDQFKQMVSLAPRSDEQISIVRFLDYANRRIEHYIWAKKKLIALLNEQKQAVIHRAVTRGLEPSVRLKSSGIPWLGDVPEHWEVVRFKASVGFQEGPGIMAADFRDRGVPLLRISCLAAEEANLDGCDYLDPYKVKENWSHFAVRAGDYLLSASGSTGVVRRAGDAVLGAIPYTGIIRLWPRSDRVEMEHLKLFMSSRLFLDQIDMAKSGVGIEHFGPTHLKRMVICLPPSEEQSAIIHKVRSETKHLNQAITRAEREIGLIREYRTRLLADVVTGQLDVRAAVAKLPEEPVESERLDEVETVTEADDTADDGIDTEPAEVET